MALRLLVKTDYGINAEYWKVTLTYINWHEKFATVTLSGFTNEVARNSGALPITKIESSWSDKDFPFTFDEKTVAKAYAKIKESHPDQDGNETNEWAKAEDC